MHEHGMVTNNKGKIRLKVIKRKINNARIYKVKVKITNKYIYPTVNDRVLYLYNIYTLMMNQPWKVL